MKIQADLEWPVRNTAIAGLVTLVMLFIVFGIWLTTANLSGVVIVKGQLSHRVPGQEIQHVRGGVVDRVFVTEGQNVHASDVLIRLTDPGAISEHSILSTRMNELFVRRARLIAERDGADQVIFPQNFAHTAQIDPALRKAMAGQVRLFHARKLLQSQEVLASKDSSRQIEIQISGINAQIDALERQAFLIGKQLAGQDQLFAKGLATANTVLALNREAAIIQGKIGSARASIARADESITAIQIELLRAQSQRREDAISQLRDLEFRLSELAEQRESLVDRISDLDIRAPRSGVVLDLSQIDEKSVIEAAQVLMQIVSQSHPDRVTARIPSHKIDQVFHRQSVEILFPGAVNAISQRIKGQVVRLSAGKLTDERTGAGYYRAEIAFDTADLEQLLRAGRIFPDMPVDVYIKTIDQPVWAYLAKPIFGFLSRSMRET